MSCLSRTTLADMLPQTDSRDQVDAYARAIATATYKQPCCEAVYDGDLLGCTCWTKVHDKDQAKPDLDGTVVPGVQPKMCKACAYRPSSPERTGRAEAKFDQARLEEIVEKGEPFWCHEGMRQVIALVHGPTGTRIEFPFELDYDPPIVPGRPYQADGTHALLCGGWSARRLQHVIKLEGATP